MPLSVNSQQPQYLTLTFLDLEPALLHNVQYFTCFFFRLTCFPLRFCILILFHILKSHETHCVWTGPFGVAFQQRFRDHSSNFCREGRSAEMAQREHGATVPCLRILMGGKNGRNAKIEFEVWDSAAAQNQTCPCLLFSIVVRSIINYSFVARSWRMVICCIISFDVAAVGRLLHACMKRRAVSSDLSVGARTAQPVRLDDCVYLCPLSCGARGGLRNIQIY